MTKELLPTCLKTHQSGLLRSVIDAGLTRPQTVHPWRQSAQNSAWRYMAPEPISAHPRSPKSQLLCKQSLPVHLLVAPLQHRLNQLIPFLNRKTKRKVNLLHFHLLSHCMNTHIISIRAEYSIHGTGAVSEYEREREYIYIRLRGKALPICISKKKIWFCASCNDIFGPLFTRGPWRSW